MGEAIKTDVVIIGGGISGLSAALRIKDTNTATGAGITCVVLEGSDRFGGRTWTRDGVDMDFGGGYIGGTQTQIQFLQRRFQLPTITTFLPFEHEFKWLYQSNQNAITRFPGDNPFAFPGGENALALLLRLDGMCIEVRNSLQDPSKSALSYLDQIDVQAWIDGERKQWDDEQKKPKPDITQGMSPATAEVFVTSVRSAFSLEPREISFFFLLYYAATAGGYSSLVDVAGGTGAAEGTRFTFGTKSLVDAILTELALDAANIAFRTQARVTNIAYRDDGATVTLSDKTVYEAKHVIVAMSPPASNKLTYSPAFDKSGNADAQRRFDLCTQMAKCMGRTIKGFVRFERPFWRERNLMGFLLSAAPYQTSPLDWTLDNVWEDPTGNLTDQYSLMTFIVGDAATYWSGPNKKQQRAEAVLDHLKQVYRFDDSVLLDPKNPTANYVEEDWPTQIGAGVAAPGAMMPPGVLANLGSALRTPIKVIHWAGSEAALEWCGYMNGAIESGFRAASEALAPLLKALQTHNTTPPPFAA
jgi:monoamine oxidase